jgi:hypothetical protein
MDREALSSLCGECDMDRLGFLNQIWIATRLVCSFCEAMAGSLSEASTEVLLAKVAVVDLVRLVGLHCIAGMIMAIEHCLGVRPH